MIVISTESEDSDFLEILTGCSFIVPGEFVRKTRSSPVAQWYFLQTTVFF
jgi:hypothetical protein